MNETIIVTNVIFTRASKTYLCYNCGVSIKDRHAFIYLSGEKRNQ